MEEGRHADPFETQRPRCGKTARDSGVTHALRQAPRQRCAFTPETRRQTTAPRTSERGFTSSHPRPHFQPPLLVCESYNQDKFKIKSASDGDCRKQDMARFYCQKSLSASSCGLQDDRGDWRQELDMRSCRLNLQRDACAMLMF
ncbi:uncharacterized [Tachysurus ichikawai]